MSACHEGESYYRSESFSLSRINAVPSKPGTCWRGCRVQKRMVETIYYAQTSNILPGLAERSSRNLPRKAARVRMTSQGKRFGTEGSTPSLGTTAVMRYMNHYRFSFYSLTAGKDRHLGEAQLVRPSLMTAKTLSEAGGSSPPSSHKYRSDAIFHNFFDYWYTQGGQIPPTTGRYTAARSGNDAVVHIWYIYRGFDSPRPDQLKN